MLYFGILSYYVHGWSFTFFDKYMTEELVYAYCWNFECVLIFIKTKCRYQSHYKIEAKKIFKNWGTNPQMNFPLKLMKWKGAHFKKWNILYFETLMRNWFKYIFFQIWLKTSWYYSCSKIWTGIFSVLLLVFSS